MFRFSNHNHRDLFKGLTENPFRICVLLKYPVMGLVGIRRIKCVLDLGSIMSS